MSPEEKVAAALAWKGEITLRDLQTALEWQREAEASVLDVLVYLGLTDDAHIVAAADSLDTKESLSFGEPVRELVRERRDFKRLDVPDGFVVTIDGANGLLNLSLGGVGYATAKKPDNGSKIPVHIQTPAGGELGTEGTVRFVREAPDGFTVGLEFLDLSPGSLMVLDSIVNEIHNALTAPRSKRD